VIAALTSYVALIARLVRSTEPGMIPVAGSSPGVAEGSGRSVELGDGVGRGGASVWAATRVVGCGPRLGVGEHAATRRPTTTASTERPLLRCMRLIVDAAARPATGRNAVLPNENPA
jgi:hypothetical protein